MNLLSGLLAPQPTQSQQMLGTLNRSGKHIYPGTVPAHVVARRRGKNRAARKSRRTNRSHR